MSDELGTDITLFRGILLVELSAVFLEVATDLTLLLLCEESGWPWSPEQLFEAIDDVFLDFLTTEVPDGIAIFDLRRCVC